MKTYLTRHTLKTEPNPGTPDHIKALLEKDTPLEKIEVVDVGELLCEFKKKYVEFTDAGIFVNYTLPGEPDLDDWLRERLS